MDVNYNDKLNKFLANQKKYIGGSMFGVHLRFSEFIYVARIYVGVAIKEANQKLQKTKATVLSAQTDYWY